MGRRPQPNPLRGILRAAAVAIVLIIIVVVGLLVASSFGAPAVHAPTVVPSPQNLRTATPTKAKKTATPSAHATPSPTKKKGASLGASPSFNTQTASNRSGGKVVERMLPARAGRIESASPSPDGRRLAYFLRLGGATARNPLFVSESGSGGRTQVGYGDSLVRPIWSPGGRYVLYVRVRQAAGVPGADWSLVLVDTRTKRARVLARVAAMALTPLGWSRNKILVLVADSTDTSIFSVSSGSSKLVGIMMAQAILSARLSPDGRFIAFGAPTNCASCSLYIYDLRKEALSSGPSGMPDDTTLAWTADGSDLATILGNRLILLSAQSLSTTSFPIPRGLPRSWNNPMRAVFRGNSLTLVDLVTHRAYRSSR